MSKALLFSNLLWVPIAAVAYFLGTQKSKNAADSVGQTAPGKQTTGVVASRKSAKATDSGSNSASTSKATDDVNQWLAKFREAGGVISPEKMAQAVMEAVRESDPIKSMLYFSQLVTEITPESAPLAMKALRENTGGFDSMRYLGLLGYAWGQKDGKAALAAFDDMGGREGGFMRGTALAGWAASDPSAALAYMKEVKAAASPYEENERGRGGRGGDGREAFGLERGLISGLARNDFNAAYDYVMSLEENQRAWHTGALVEQKIRDGLSSAADWAMGLSDERMRSQALEEVSRQYSRSDIKGAVEWASKIAGQEGSARAVGEIADRYAEQDPGVAFKWAGNLPAGEAQSRAYSEVIGEWVREDPTAASAALRELPAGEAKDSAIASFSRNLIRENPGNANDAISWASRIGDPEQRLEAQIDVARAWLRTDAPTAQAWIQQNLPADAQQEVTEPREERWGGFGGRFPGFPGGGRER